MGPRTFTKVEEVLRYYRAFAKDPDNKIDIKIRNAGEPMWKKFDLFAQKLNEKVEQLKQFTEEFVTQSNETFEHFLTPEYKERLTTLIEAFDEEHVIKFPPGIPKKDKMNVILIGPSQSGKSTILKEQMKTQFRGVVSIADLVQWNNENGFEETTKKIGEYQEIKKKEYDELKTQRDKLAKQAKSNKKIVVPDPPSENMYKFVSKEIFEELNKIKTS